MSGPIGLLEFSLILGLGVLALVFSVRSDRKARAMIAAWAEGEGMRVLHLEQRWLRRGPYTWNSGKSQLVYLVTLWDGRARRSAYVRCGGWFLGMLTEQMDVSWVEG